MVQAKFKMSRADNGRARSGHYGTLNSYSNSHQSLIEEPIYHLPRSKCSTFNQFLGFSLRHEPISNIRRTFLLLVLFDLIISTILWIIYIEIAEITEDPSNDPVCGNDKFCQEVVKYNIKKSLFDTVMLAFVRFVTLELFYAVLNCSKPWVVAVTTFISSTFLVAKVVLFVYIKNDRSNSAKNFTAVEIIDLILLISALVLSWVETWVLDLKVLPRERRDRERLLIAERCHERNPTVTSPLIHRVRTEETFHSPEGSPDTQSLASYSGSDDARSFHTVASARSRAPSLISADQAELYIERVKRAEQFALDQLAMDDWTKSHGNDEIQGVVYSKTTSQYGKIFKLVAQLDMDPLTFYNDQVENVERMPEWNPTVTEQRVLEKVDDHTDIIYNVGAEQVGGMVSSRDFVFIRHYGQTEGKYLISSVNVDHPTMPKQKNHVRGEHGPGIIKLVDAEDGKTRMEWLLNTNLKGWLPQYAIDQALSFVLMSQLQNMREHCVVIQAL